jgi:hypothetical protein
MFEYWLNVAGLFSLRRSGTQLRSKYRYPLFSSFCPSLHNLQWSHIVNPPRIKIRLLFSIRRVTYLDTTDVGFSFLWILIRPS